MNSIPYHFFCGISCPFPRVFLPLSPGFPTSFPGFPASFTRTSPLRAHQECPITTMIFMVSLSFTANQMLHFHLFKLLAIPRPDECEDDKEMCGQNSSSASQPQVVFCDGIKQLSIDHPPPVLCLHLKR